MKRVCANRKVFAEHLCSVDQVIKFFIAAPRQQGNYVIEQILTQCDYFWSAQMRPPINVLISFLIDERLPNDVKSTLVKRIISNGALFSKLILNMLDLATFIQAIPPEHPEDVDQVVKRVLSNEIEFKRLILNWFDLTLLIRVIPPQYIEQAMKYAISNGNHLGVRGQFLGKWPYLARFVQTISDDSRRISMKAGLYESYVEWVVEWIISMDEDFGELILMPDQLSKFFKALPVNFVDRLVKRIVSDDIDFAQFISSSFSLRHFLQAIPTECIGADLIVNRILSSKTEFSRFFRSEIDVEIFESDEEPKIKAWVPKIREAFDRFQKEEEKSDLSISQLMRSNSDSELVFQDQLLSEMKVEVGAGADDVAVHADAALSAPPQRAFNGSPPGLTDAPLLSSSVSSFSSFSASTSSISLSGCSNTDSQSALKEVPPSSSLSATLE